MTKKSIRFLTSKNFIDSKILYGFFTRNGGKSIKSFNSLNCNFNIKDKKINVLNNIALAKNKIGLENTKLKLISQIHSSKVVIINSRNIEKKIVADGVINCQKNISLAILTADCAPIFLIDPIKKIICAIHSGWRGCLNNIILKGSKKLLTLNKSLENTTAIIGPCLGQKNFEVDNNFKKKFILKKKHYEIFFKKDKKNNRIFFDMRGLIEDQLRDSSINNVLNVDYNTYSEKDLFFSHRRETHKKALPTGRMINIIGFRQ